jgi:thiol:disulfide interchange protein
MRGLALLAFGCALVSCGKARLHPSWRDVLPWRYDFAAAREESMRTGKPGVLFFHADWCENHNDVAIEAFREPRIADDIATRFVPVAIDVTDEDVPAIARLMREYQPLSAPALVVVDSSFRRIDVGVRWTPEPMARPML